jgi:acyl-CoA thioesterase-1
MGLFLKGVSARAYGAVAALRNVTIAWIVTGSAVFAEPVTIVALGDSLTAGYGLEEGQGFVPVLEAWLKGKGADVVVQNAGVSGDTTAGGLSRIDWALGPDADAVIVTLGGNDMLRGVDPAEAKRNLEGIMAAVAARGLPALVVGMKAPGNYGPDYKAAFDAMYAEIATAHGAVLATSFFDGLIAAGADPGDPASMVAFMQADGIHPNPDGVLKIVEGLGPKVMDLIAQVK